MPLPKIYSQNTETPIVNVDFFDFADGGIGYATLYGSCLTSGARYVLTKNQVYSDTLATQSNVTSSAWIKEIDLDFDVDINGTTTLMGNVQLNIPLKPVSSGANNTLEGYVHAYLRKVNAAGTESEIANASSAIIINTQTASVTSYNKERMAIVQIDSPQTTFKNGEKLRLTVEGWGRRTGTGHTSTTLAVGHDPKNRLANAVGPDIAFSTTHGDNTNMIVQLPIKIPL